MFMPMYAPPVAAAPVGPMQYSFTGSNANTTYSLTRSLSVPIGAANAGRLVVVCVRVTRQGTSDNLFPSLVSATIGGVAASILVQRNGSANAESRNHCAIIAAPIPSGTSTTVAMTFANTGVCAISAYRLINLQSTSPVATANRQLTAQDRPITVNALAGGVMLAIEAITNTAGINVLSGTKDNEYLYAGRVATASGAVSSNGNRTITFRRADAGTSIGTAVAASFR